MRRLSFLRRLMWPSVLLIVAAGLVFFDQDVEQRVGFLSACLAALSAALLRPGSVADCSVCSQIAGDATSAHTRACFGIS